KQLDYQLFSITYSSFLYTSPLAKVLYLIPLLWLYGYPSPLGRVGVGLIFYFAKKVFFFEKNYYFKPCFYRLFRNVIIRAFYYIIFILIH
ncbi:MAG: hypothetical protein RLZZ292_3551, partial [Bacteroidota bacterium]